jgi:hypothetical protein
MKVYVVAPAEAQYVCLDLAEHNPKVLRPHGTQDEHTVCHRREWSASTSVLQILRTSSRLVESQRHPRHLGLSSISACFDDVIFEANFL